MYILNMFFVFKESKIDRENYFMKEDFKWVFENIIKFVVIRSFIDRRLSFFYRIKEDSKLGKM